jgi:hypothetical protein
MFELVEQFRNMRSSHAPSLAISGFSSWCGVILDPFVLPPLLGVMVEKYVRNTEGIITDRGRLNYL